MNILTRALVAVAAIALMGQADARAQSRQPEGPLLKAFDDICVRAAGDHDRALAIAADAGWRETDGSNVYRPDSIPAGMRFRASDARDLEMTVTVVEARDDEDPDAPDLGLCSIIAYPTNAMRVFDPDPMDELAHWLEMFPHPEFTTDEMDVYVFTAGADGGRESLAGRSELALAQAALTGRAHVIHAQMFEDQSVILSYGVPRSR